MENTPPISLEVYDFYFYFFYDCWGFYIWQGRQRITNFNNESKVKISDYLFGFHMLVLGHDTRLADA